jgi:hypothetical protein
MDRSLKFVHLVGMALFLGSIAVYIALSPWAKADSLDRLLFARQVIALGTSCITLPALWLTVAAGFVMGLRLRPRFGAGWVRFKLIAGVLMLLNSHLLVAPAVRAAVVAAEASARAGTLLPAFGTAAAQESLAGAVNVLMALAAAAVGVWKPRRARPSVGAKSVMPA